VPFSFSSQDGETATSFTQRDGPANPRSLKPIVEPHTHG
jgi:hypothetical protein